MKAYEKYEGIMLSLLPKLLFEKLTDIQPSFLQKRNIRLLLMDFDNTMLPYTTNEPTERLLAWIHTMQESGIALCIVSNSKRPRVPHFCEKYGIDCVTRAGKPTTGGVKKAMQRFTADKAETALVGDQIYTDVLGANLAGVLSIQVKSIHNHTIWLKLRHLLEVPFLAMAQNRRVKKD